MKTNFEKQKQEIDNMSHFSLCHLWRFGKSDNPLFHGDAGDYFEQVLFRDRGGFTPEISKQLNR